MDCFEESSVTCYRYVTLDFSPKFYSSLDLEELLHLNMCRDFKKKEYYFKFKHAISFKKVPWIYQNDC